MSELDQSAAEQSAAPTVVRTGRPPNRPLPRVTAVAVDAASAAPAYANFFRVTHTPDEIVLDLGFDNGLRPERQTAILRADHRLVLTSATARRLVKALVESLERQMTECGSAVPKGQHEHLHAGHAH